MSSPLPTHAPSSTPPPSNETKLPTQPSGTLSTRLRIHLRQPIVLQYAWVPLLLCCFISGLVDAAAFNAWVTFVSMQTGNTIFLALGASSQPLTPRYTWLKGLTAITFFLTGCVGFANCMRALGHGGKSRGALISAFSVQVGLVIIAAGLVQGGLVPVPNGVVTPADKSPENPRFIELVTIAMLAFQAGGQIVTSRLLGFTELPTTVLTSTYCDIGSDVNLLAKNNDKRDRRVISVVCLLVGGICGGWISRSEGGMAVVLWLAAALKFGILASFVVWKGVTESEHIA